MTIPSTIHAKAKDLARAFLRQIKTVCLSLVLATPLLTTATQTISPTVKPWPLGKRAALSLTYDDALSSQLDIALPQLNRLGFKATFYVTVESPIFLTRVDEWRQASVDGHELGNHSLFHPCYGGDTVAGRDWVKSESDLSNYSVARVIRELGLANGVLGMIDGKQQRTFAYPCSDTSAGQKSFINAIKPLFSAARLTVDQTSSTEQYTLPSLAADQVDTNTMIDYVKSLMQSGGYGTITFHGVGGDYLSVSAESHQVLLDFLAKHQQELWVTSVQNVAAHLYQP